MNRHIFTDHADGLDVIYTPLIITAQDVNEQHPHHLFLPLITATNYYDEKLKSRLCSMFKNWVADNNLPECQHDDDKLWDYFAQRSSEILVEYIAGVGQQKLPSSLILDAIVKASNEIAIKKIQQLMQDGEKNGNKIIPPPSDNLPPTDFKTPFD